MSLSDLWRMFCYADMLPHVTATLRAVPAAW